MHPINSTLSYMMGGAIILGTVLTSPAQSSETFFDDFHRFDQGRWYASDGWANGDYQNCIWSSRAVAIHDGNLRLFFGPQKSETRDYVCGEIQTRTAYSFGTFEARFKTGEGSGLNAAFFTYIGPTHGMPHDEIDFEVLTRDTSRITVNTYVAGEARNGSAEPLEVAADDAFSTYSFIWEPERLRWFVDGTLVHEAAGDDLPSHPQRIFFSLWGSDAFPDWMGRFDPPSGPVMMEVDWVAYTSPGQTCAFPESVLCSLE